MSMGTSTESRGVTTSATRALKVTATKRDFLRIANQMAGIAERKSTMPVLAMVLLTAADGRLSFAATDLYLQLTGSIDADVAAPGALAVGAKELVDRVKQMPDGKVILEAKGDALVLKAAGTARRFTMRTIPGEDFPPMADPGDAPTLAMPASLLRSLIARVTFAVSTDVTRPHLNSGLLEWEGDRVRMVATDGHRLALAQAKVDGRIATTSMLIPLKAMNEVARLCEEIESAAPQGEGERPIPQIKFAQVKSKVFFHAAGLTFGVTTTDAQFPPYEQVIPKSSARRLRAPRSALTETIRAVAVAAAEKTGGIRLVIAGSQLRVSSENPETGDGFDELEVEYSGESLTIGFAFRYLLDAFGIMSTDELDVGFGGELDPMVVRPSENPDDHLVVIMPIRI